MKFGHLVPTSLVVVLFSTIANGMFNKDAAKSDPMASMVIGMLGKECETLYDKTMDKVDKVYHPAWDWVLGTCDKACGKSAEMQQAVPYLPYVFNFVDRLFIFMKKSSVALDIWKLCPRLLTKKVFYDIVDKVMKKCMKAPDGVKVMNAKDLCHLTSNEAFNKTANCIKELAIGEITPKIMPPPMDCVGGVKKYCATKHHPVIMGWIDLFMVDMLKTKDKPKTLKDKFNNAIEAAYNAFAVIKRFFDGKCKTETKFTDKWKMPTA